MWNALSRGIGQLTEVVAPLLEEEDEDDLHDEEDMHDVPAQATASSPEVADASSGSSRPSVSRPSASDNDPVSHAKSGLLGLVGSGVLPPGSTEATNGDANSRGGSGSESGAGAVVGHGEPAVDDATTDGSASSASDSGSAIRVGGGGGGGGDGSYSPPAAHVAATPDAVTPPEDKPAVQAPTTHPGAQEPSPLAAVESEPAAPTPDHGSDDPDDPDPSLAPPAAATVAAPAPAPAPAPARVRTFSDAFASLSGEPAGPPPPRQEEQVPEELAKAQGEVRWLRQQLEMTEERQNTLVHEYQRFIRERDDECQRLQEQVKALKANVRDATMKAGRATSFEEDLEALRQVNASMKHAMASELKSQKAAADEQISALRKLVNTTGKELETTHAKLVTAREELSVLKDAAKLQAQFQADEQARLSSEAERLRQAGAEADTRSTAAKERVVSLESRVEALQHAATTAQERVAELEREAQVATRQAAQDKQELEARVAALNLRVQAEAAEADAKEKAWQARLEGAEQQLQARTAEAQEKDAATDDRVAQLTSEVQRLRASLAGAEAAAKAVAHEALHAHTHAHVPHEDVSTSTDGPGNGADLPIEPSPMRTTGAVVRRELAATAAQLAAVTQQLEQSQADMVNLQASSKADLATLREQLQETQNALGAARAEKQTAERALEAAQLAHKETVATTNHTHKEQVRALEQQVAALREDLRLQEQTSQAEMTSARSNERAAVQKLDAAVQEAAAAAQASERQKEAVQQRVAELEAQIASTTSHAETANADAQNLLRELRADTKTAQDARQAAEDKLARFKTEMHNLRDDVARAEAKAKEEADRAAGVQGEMDNQTARLNKALQGQRAAGDAYRKLQASYQKLQGDLRQSYDETRAVRSQLEAREAQLQDTHAQAERLQKQLTDSEDVAAELDAARRQADDAFARTDAAEQEVKRLRAAAAQLASQGQQRETWLQGEVEAARKELDSVRAQYVEAGVKLARLDELESSNARLTADLRLREDDARRSEAACAKLQRVLERFQTQRESSEHALHNLISDLKAQLAAEATKAQEVVVQAVAKAQEEAVSQQAAAVAEVGEQLRQQEALVAKARQERDALQRALQDSLKRLRSGDGELVDRRIVTKLLVTYFERPQSSREVLDLMSRMLNFSQEDKVRVGLVSNPESLLSSSLSWLGLSGEAPPLPTPDPDSRGKSLADLWVEFLVNEAETSAAPGAAAGAGAGAGDHEAARDSPHAAGGAASSSAVAADAGHNPTFRILDTRCACLARREAACSDSQATTLLQALKDGEEDEHVLVRLIESAPSIDQVDEDGCTVLHLAAAASIPVELLGKVLQASADDAVTLIDHDERLPLHHAVDAAVPSLAKIALLLEAFPEGAKRADSADQLPLHVYIANSAPTMEKVLALLLDAHHDALQATDDFLLYGYPDAVNAVDTEGFTPLHLALMHPHEDTLAIVKALVGVDAHVTSAAGPHRTQPMVYAAQFCDTDVLEYLNSVDGDSVCLPTEQGELALHAACAAKRPTSVLNLLLEWFPEGASVPNNDGIRPIDMSRDVKRAYNAMFDLPNDDSDGEGSDGDGGNATPTEGASPMQPTNGEAESKGHTADPEAVHLQTSGEGDIAPQLVGSPGSNQVKPRLSRLDVLAGRAGGSGRRSSPRRSPRSPATRLGVGGSLLTLLEQYEHGRESELSMIQLRQMLVGNPECASAASEWGVLPLHVAVASPFPISVVRAVYEAYPGAVKRKDKQGRLPLHFAVGCSKPTHDTVAFMLDVYPAAAGVGDEEGMLPLHCAVCSSHMTEEIVHALLSANPESPRVPDKLLRLPLHWACDSASANAHVVAALIKAYPDALDDEDSRCAMPLHLACSHSNIDPAIVKLLLQECPSAASFAGEEGNGWLPLHYALSCKYPQVEVFNELVAANPDGLFEVDANGNRPIHIAVTQARVPMEVIATIAHADPDGLRTRNADMLLPLHIACQSGTSPSVVAELAVAFPDALMDFPPPMNRLPLHWACANETPNPDVVRILVDKYPHGVTAEDASDRVPVELAARNPNATVPLLRTLCQIDPQWLFNTNTADACAARILVDTGKEDFIAFVMEQQQLVPEDMRITIPPRATGAPSSAQLSNPLSEQSFVGGSPARRPSTGTHATDTTPVVVHGDHQLGVGTSSPGDMGGDGESANGAGVTESRSHRSTAGSTVEATASGADQPNAREQELEAELRRVQTDMELIKRELHKLQEGQTAQKSSKCCCVIM